MKIGPEIDKKLYAKFAKVAEQNGQSVRATLERAMQNYIQLVAPSRNTVRPRATAHFQRSTARIRKLHQLLAKS